MIPAEFKDGEDWLSVAYDDEENNDFFFIFVHANFLTSNWRCMFGDGCPGLFAANEPHYYPDSGCCRHGFWATSEEDERRVDARVAELTDQDWDAELRREYEKRGGWKIVYSRGPDGDINAKSRIVDGGCIFQNRTKGSVGKQGRVGCAFHHLGERTGRPDHVDTMPGVCWQLPLRSHYDTANNLWVYPWNIEQWGPVDEDGSANSFTCWWCVDSPEAYSGDQMLYKSMERELRAMMPKGAYELVVEALETRMRDGYRFPKMAGATRNDGRPLLPLLIGNRTPAVQPNVTHTPQVIADMKKENDDRPAEQQV